MMAGAKKQKKSPMELGDFLYKIVELNKKFGKVIHKHRDNCTNWDS